MKGHCIDSSFVAEIEKKFENFPKKPIYTQAVALALYSHATLMKEVYGKITHSQLKSEARNLIDMGIPADQVDKALLRVEKDIHNISI
jgi:hypothetical protein